MALQEILQECFARPQSLINQAVSETMSDMFHLGGEWGLSKGDL